MLTKVQIPITASIAIEDITSDIPSPSTTFFFQLYVAKDRTASESLLRRVWKLGIRTLFVTIDAPVAGKREADEKVKAEEMISMPMTGTRSKNDGAGSGLTRTTGSFIDSSFCWEDLSWVKKHWPGKIVIKGIQSVENAQMAVEVGVSGIVLRLVGYYPILIGYSEFGDGFTNENTATTAAATSTLPRPDY